jgi:hypothetical protein
MVRAETERRHPDSQYLTGQKSVRLMSLKVERKFSFR